MAKLVKPGGAYVPAADSSYLLLDEIGMRICACWHLAPQYGICIDEDGTATSEPLLLFDLANAVSRWAACTVNEAADRIEVLRAVAILHDDGTVDEAVQKRLNNLGARRMGLTDDEKEEPTDGD